MRNTLVLTAWCALVPISAAAQLPHPPSTAGSTQTLDDVRSNSQIHVGPFYVRPAILLRELGVDTNVFNQPENPQSDFTFTMTPQADVAVPMARRGLLRTRLGADLVYYKKFDTERAINPQATVRLEWYARRITLFGEGAFLNTKDRANYEIDVRTRHKQNNISAGIILALAAKSSIEVAVHREETRFDDDATYFGADLSDVLDSKSTGGSSTFRYRHSALTTFAGRFERLEQRFPTSPVRDNSSYRIMPGVELRPRALISGSAYVGYRSLKPVSPLLPSYTGLVSQVGLSYTLLGATTFGVTADRDITFSFEEFTPYFVDNSYGVFVRRAIGGKWDVLGNLTRHRYSYRNLQTETPVGAPERVDITDNYGANLGYRLKRQTRLGFGVAYYTRSSTTASFRDYDGLRVGTTVSYGF